MSKRRIVGLFGVVLCLLAACKTDPLYEDIEGAQLETDIKLIETYIEKNKIDAKRTDEGLFYVIGAAGAGETIKLEDQLRIQYKANYLEDGIKPLFFDSTASTDPELATKFILNTAIEGWQKGIPLVRKGGEIRLIVPSKMAYQNRVINKLPKNSILDFDIKVIDVLTPEQVKEKEEENK